MDEQLILKRQELADTMALEIALEIDAQVLSLSAQEYVALYKNEGLVDLVIDDLAMRIVDIFLFYSCDVPDGGDPFFIFRIARSGSSFNGIRVDKDGFKVFPGCGPINQHDKQSLETILAEVMN